MHAEDTLSYEYGYPLPYARRCGLRLAACGLQRMLIEGMLLHGMGWVTEARILSENV